VFVEFALVAVMSPGLVPLPLDMVSLDVGTPAVRPKEVTKPGMSLPRGSVFFLVHGLVSEGVSMSEGSGGAC